jgi:hypothetical protein
MRKQAALLFRRPLLQWIKKTPQEVLIIGCILMIYLLHSSIVLMQMLFELY